MSKDQPWTEGEPLAGGPKPKPQPTIAVAEVMTTRVETCSSASRKNGDPAGTCAGSYVEYRRLGPGLGFGP